MAGMGSVWSTEVEMHFLFSLAWDGFGQPKLRYSFVHAGKEAVWSAHVEMYFLNSLFLGGVWSTMLRYILCPRWERMRLVNTSMVNLMSSLSWEGYGQHKLCYILRHCRHLRGLVNTK